MKLLYLWHRGEDIPGLKKPSPSGDVYIELTKFEPPDIENPYWEFHFEDGISIYADGKILLVIQEDKIGNGGSKEKVVRMKRVKDV